MLLADTPSLGPINGPAARLRILALKAHNYATLNKLNGGDYGPAVLSPFWAEQIKLMDAESGTPFDGSYLGFGIEDIRPECYLVQSAVRLSKNETDKAKLLAFCKFWMEQADALAPSNKVVVDSIRITDPAEGDVPVLGWDDSLLLSWELYDKEGNKVEADLDNPLPGNVQVSFTNGKDVPFSPTRSSDTTAWDTATVGQVEGHQAVNFYYMLDGEHTLVSEFRMFQRLPAVTAPDGDMEVKTTRKRASRKVEE